MSAHSDKDAYSRRNGQPEAPFDPADYARPDAADSPPGEDDDSAADDSAPDPLSGDEENAESSGSGPRWLQFVKRNWRSIPAWGFLCLVTVKSVSVICIGPGWDGDNIPQAILLVYLLAELFFSDSVCASLVSCFLLTDFFLVETFTHNFWPYSSLFQIIVADLGLLLILLKERYYPLKVVNVPVLGLHFVFFVFRLAEL